MVLPGWKHNNPILVGGGAGLTACLHAQPLALQPHLEHKMKPCTLLTQYLNRKGQPAAESSSSGQAPGGRSARKRAAQQQGGGLLTDLWDPRSTYLGMFSVLQ
jgi:hypothetical protein